MKERNSLVESALPAVRNVAFMVARRYPSADVDDLMQLGAVGAMQAAETFEAARGIPFPAFAYRRIRGAMLDSLRRRKATDEFEHVHIDGEPDGESLPACTLDVDAIHERIDSERRFATVKRAMRGLTKDQRAVVRIHYISGRTLREAADKIGVTPPRASQIRATAVRKIRDKIAA